MLCVAIRECVVGKGSSVAGSRRREDSAGDVSTASSLGPQPHSGEPSSGEPISTSTRANTALPRRLHRREREAYEQADSKALNFGGILAVMTPEAAPVPLRLSKGCHFTAFPIFDTGSSSNDRKR